MDDVIDWTHNHQTLIWWLVAISAATFLATLIAVPWIVVRLPADYFTPDYETTHRERHPVAHVAIKIGRNIVGYAFIIVGIAMLILPGQGVLTIVAGLGLVDFPGKHRLIQRIVERKPVRMSLDWIRDRSGKPHFTLKPNSARN